MCWSSQFSSRSSVPVPRHWVLGFGLVKSTQRVRLTLFPFLQEKNRVRVQFPVPASYFGMQPTSHPRPTAFHLSGVGRWVPASAEKAKAGMVHSVSGCTPRGVQVKLRDPLRTRAVLERVRGVFTTRRYTNPRTLPYLTAPNPIYVAP